MFYDRPAEQPTRQWTLVLMCIVAIVSCYGIAGSLEESEREDSARQQQIDEAHAAGFSAGRDAAELAAEKHWSPRVVAAYKQGQRDEGERQLQLLRTAYVQAHPQRVCTTATR